MMNPQAFFKSTTPTFSAPLALRWCCCWSLGPSHWWCRHQSRRDNAMAALTLQVVGHLHEGHDRVGSIQGCGSDDSIDMRLRRRRHQHGTAATTTSTCDYSDDDIDTELLWLRRQHRQAAVAATIFTPVLPAYAAPMTMAST